MTEKSDWMKIIERGGETKRRTETVFERDEENGRK